MDYTGVKPVTSAARLLPTKRKGLERRPCRQRPVQRSLRVLKNILPSRVSLGKARVSFYVDGRVARTIGGSGADRFCVHQL
jgi:hypothetical protein